MEKAANRLGRKIDKPIFDESPKPPRPVRLT